MLRQAAHCDSWLMSPHCQRPPGHSMATSVPRTSCVIIMSAAGPGQQIESNWQPVIIVAVFLRIFCSSTVYWGREDIMVATFIQPLSITCSLILVIFSYWRCDCFYASDHRSGENPGFVLRYVLDNCESLAEFRPNLSWSISSDIRIGSPEWSGVRLVSSGSPIWSKDAQ